ncbi:MAG: hypothetical protein HYZ93_05435 [Candidatus Omnitrophica bacterium]|nr:hypothetical protein [Candidatus Omnitrophota bacterium]
MCLCVISAPLSWPAVARAAEPASQVKSDEAADRAKLFITLLKRRAERVLEAHRAPPPPVATVSGGVSTGYESNPNLDGARKGDAFAEESFSVAFRPPITHWLKGEFVADFSNTNYLEFTDLNLRMTNLAGAFQIQPRPPLRLDLGVEYGILNFPLDADSSFFDKRAKAHLSLAQTPWLTHKVGWTYQLREYDTLKAHDSAQNRLEGLNRQDQRHVALYELQLRFPKTFARAGVEWYRNFSNDQYQEFYDWEDILWRGILIRSLNPRLLAVLVGSQERKNYEARSVPAINVAERDDLWTATGSLIYQLRPHTSLTCSTTYRYQDSNDPRLDFTDWIYQVGLEVEF